MVKAIDRRLGDNERVPLLQTSGQCQVRMVSNSSTCTSKFLTSFLNWRLLRLVLSSAG